MGARAILSALPFLLKQKAKEELYRAYIAESLYCIAENTARSVGGVCMTQKYTELINRKPPDTRTGGEIAAEVINKLGLKAVKK